MREKFPEFSVLPDFKNYSELVQAGALAIKNAQTSVYQFLNILPLLTRPDWEAFFEILMIVSPAKQETGEAPTAAPFHFSSKRRPSVVFDGYTKPSGTVGVHLALQRGQALAERPADHPRSIP